MAKDVKDIVTRMRSAVDKMKAGAEKYSQGLKEYNEISSDYNTLLREFDAYRQELAELSKTAAEMGLDVPEVPTIPPVSEEEKEGEEKQEQPHIEIYRNKHLTPELYQMEREKGTPEKAMMERYITTEGEVRSYRARYAAVSRYRKKEFTTKELSRLSGISEVAIRERYKRGTIEGRKLPDGEGGRDKLRFPYETLEHLQATRKRPSRPRIRTTMVFSKEHKKEVPCFSGKQIRKMLGNINRSRLGALTRQGKLEVVKRTATDVYYHEDSANELISSGDY